VRSLLGSSADRRGLGISADGEREKALQPGDLSRLLTERANAADLDGIVALYEPDAMLAFPPGQVTTGHHAIRVLYEGMLSRKSTFPAGTQRPAIRNGDLALTSTQLPGQVTVEVARRQPDGTWLWSIDQPNLLQSADCSCRESGEG